MQTVRPRNVSITGFMGAGKDEVGIQVADTFGRDYYNTDKVFEARYGPIPTYLPKREAEFRRLESVVLRELLGLREVVVATGGGTLVSVANIELAREHSIVVWLKVDFDVAKERTANDLKNKRPLWDKDVRARFDFRQELYERAAHITVNANQPLEQVVADTLQAIDGY